MGKNLLRGGIGASIIFLYLIIALSCGSLSTGTGGGGGHTGHYKHSVQAVQGNNAGHGQKTPEAIAGIYIQHDR